MPHKSTFALMIRKIINWFKLRRQYYIIADASDNSMTVNRKLYKAMDVENTDDIRILMFRVEDCFGFIINSEETKTDDVHYSTLQYNSKHKSIGFETLNPTVNRMFYDFKFPGTITKCKLSVTKEKIKGRIYFKIHNPNV